MSAAGPTCLEDLLSRHPRRELIMIFRRVIVQVNELAVAASFQGAGVFGGMGQEMVKCPEQKASEPATLRVGSAQRTLFQQVDKEILREVLRILSAITAPPDKCVNRVAIDTIETVQGCPGFGSAFRGGSGHQSPLRREEFGPSNGRRVQRRVHNRGVYQRRPGRSTKTDQWLTWQE